MAEDAQPDRLPALIAAGRQATAAKAREAPPAARGVIRGD